MTAEALPEQVAGVALLNSAGQFGNPIDETIEPKESSFQTTILKPVKDIFQRVILGFLFWQAKQPARIESVLKSVSQVFTLENFWLFVLLSNSFPSLKD